MKYTVTIFALSTLLALPLAAQVPDAAAESGEEVFEYHVGEVSWPTGEGVEFGGILTPSLFINAAGGLFEPGSSAEDFGTTEHDPQNEWGVQGIDLHLDFIFAENLTASVNGFGHQGPGHEWEAELEEAKVRWQVNEFLAIGGGQFQNRFGFETDLHQHDWAFVNRNLTNSRFINEGEIFTQGGEIFLGTTSTGLLTFGFGGIRSHGGEHGHGDEEEDHEEEEDHGHEEEHLEADETFYQSWVFSSDFRFRLPFDDSAVVSASLAVGENGFGRNSTVYGAGLRKVWNGHDHGHGGPDFCAGATMWQGEVIGRNVDAFLEDGDEVSFSDHGFTNSIHYGISDRVTVSLRHDWISAVEIAQLSDRHRLSAALTAFVDPEQRVRARVQYDYNEDDVIGSEHVAWFQIQLQWGGTGGSHAGHGH